MIWYRHWLEMRERLLVLGLAAIVLGALPMTLFDQENAVFARLLEAQGVSVDAEALALAIARVFFVVWGGAIALCGNGLRTWYMDRIAPSDVQLPFTLTLPISRGRLMGTRLLAGWLLAVIVAALVVSSRLVAHAALGGDLPVAPVAGAAVLLAVGIAAWVVVLGGILMTRGLLLFGALFAGILVCLPLSLTLMMGGITAHVPSVALSLLALASVASGAFAFTMHRARRLEC